MSETSGIYNALLGLYTCKRYVHLSFHFSDVPPLMAAHYIQPVINESDDWLKYADNCWIVWSIRTPQDWQEKFSAISELKPCSILALEVDISKSNRSGQLPKWVWEWLDKNRSTYATSAPTLGSLIPPVLPPPKSR